LILDAGCSICLPLSTKIIDFVKYYFIGSLSASNLSIGYSDPDRSFGSDAALFRATQVFEFEQPAQEFGTTSFVI
jgi:hypothetical protein